MNGHVVKPEICEPNKLFLQNEIDNDYKKNGLPNGCHMKSSEQAEPVHRSVHSEDFEATPLLIAVLTYISYAILILFGYMRDLMRFYGLEKSRAYKELGNEVGRSARTCPAANMKIFLKNWASHITHAKLNSPAKGILILLI